MSEQSKASDWTSVTRPTYSSVCKEDHIETRKPMPNVTWLSDLLKAIDSRRQKGFTAEDLPPPFTVQKSFLHIPHKLLATDGYPKSENWLHPECQFSVPAHDNKSGTPCLTKRARDRLTGQTTASSFIPERIRTQGETRHPARAAKATANRRADQSPQCAGDDGFNREFQRYDDPVLPVEDYDRTMEIVSNLYTVYTHGHGQFVDRDTKKLICTFRFEDLETMSAATRREHQDDVDTIMMSTKLFRQLPLPKTTQTSPKEPYRLGMDESAKISSQICETFGSQDHLLGVSDPKEQSGESSTLTCLPPSNSEHNDIEEDLANLFQATSLAPPVTLGPEEEEMTKSSKGQSKRQLTTNGALLHGKMFCFGKRAGYDPAVLFAPYFPIPGVSKLLYRLFLSKLPNFGRKIGGRFHTFTDAAFLEAHKQLVDLGVPPLSSLSKDEPPMPFDFAGNFAFTFNNFHNKPHTDNDKGKVYCVWYPIDSISGKILAECEGFVLEGGWFLFPAYRIAFNFGSKYAAHIAWSGKSTFHQTMASKEQDLLSKEGHIVHYTRLGCSSQITMSLALAAAKKGTDKQWNSNSQCDRVILDCQDILNDAEREWKE